MFGIKNYTMESRLEYADDGARDIERYLRSFSNTVGFINIEENPDYQKIDVDFVWSYREGGRVHSKLIELKADTMYQTGNFFIETTSNLTKKTPGCFLYTEADYLFYYYIKEKILFILDTYEARRVFLEHQSQFRTRKTSTSFQNGKIAYESEGSLVPRSFFKKHPGCILAEVNIGGIQL